MFLEWIRILNEGKKKNSFLYMFLNDRWLIHKSVLTSCRFQKVVNAIFEPKDYFNKHILSYFLLYFLVCHHSRCSRGWQMDFNHVSGSRAFTELQIYRMWKDSPIMHLASLSVAGVTPGEWRHDAAVTLWGEADITAGHLYCSVALKSLSRSLSLGSLFVIIMSRML